MRRSLISLLPWRRPRGPVVELHGLIASRESALSLRAARPLIERAFRSVAREGTVVLDIDSPGGSPVQSDLIASLIRRQAEKAGARVLAVVGEIGASGGYWLACAADEIRANPMSVVGSIGVVGGGFGIPALLARAGVERRLYTAGENKARLDPFSPERPEDVTFVRALMSDIHDRFKDWVRQRRAGRLRAEEAVIFDGSFFLGQQALALGLIDGFGDIDAVVRELAGERAKARVFRPKRRLRLLGRLPRMLAREAVAAALEALEEHAAAPRARI
jgi:signal peptide peptidase SppA